MDISQILIGGGGIMLMSWFIITILAKFFPDDPEQ